MYSACLETSLSPFLGLAESSRIHHAGRSCNHHYPRDTGEVRFPALNLDTACPIPVLTVCMHLEIVTPDLSACLQIPDQMQCPYEKAMRRFDNRNALIEDPVQHIQEEKKLRPWMPEEKRIFNEKFLAHPKVRCCP